MGGGQICDSKPCTDGKIALSKKRTAATSNDRFLKKEKLKVAQQGRSIILCLVQRGKFKFSRLRE